MDKLLKSGTFSSGVPLKTDSHNTPPSEAFFPAATGGGVAPKSMHSDEVLTFVDDDNSDESKSGHYTIVSKITSGRYGEVYEGLAKEPSTHNGQQVKVAVKKVPMHAKYWRQHAQREIKALKKISHINVIKLLSTTEEDDYTVILLELCQTDLYIMQQNNVVFDLEEVRSIALMTLRGLKAIHDVGIMHRDMKLSNLLLSKEGVVKVCDFGLARVDNEESPFTLQISTRWYKALEVLLGEKKYCRKVDIWAMGAILAELVSGKVLFNGNCDLHVLSQIFQIMGSEHYQNPEWVERKTYPQYGHFIWSKKEPVDLSAFFGIKDSLFVHLVKKMLTFSVAARPSVDDCLAHEWFKTASPVCPSLKVKAREKYEIPRSF